VAFVTGANRGLGLAFVRELVRRGAKKVYVGVRDPAAFDLPGVVPVKLDVTDSASVSPAAARCGDVTLLVNNAGIGRVNAGALDPAVIESAREIFETNFYGRFEEVRHSRQCFWRTAAGRSSTCCPMPPGSRGRC
jgi:NAD(P)-dependent dehydrogenase (short-subunit alcohol dehydrogenase family)